MVTVLESLAEYAASLRTANLPAEVVHAAKRCMIDWFAAAIPGGIEPPATLLAKALDDELDRGRARLVPSGRRTSPRTAALINGTAAHTIEFDDIFRDAIYHPGAPTIAAALALAQHRQTGGKSFLRAIVAGYEVSTRIGVAVNPAHYRFWHTTGTVGTFGAAAAAASLLDLKASMTVHALANAATFAAGLQQAFRADAMSKPLHAGHAAEAGVTTALAAAEGVTGAADILEGVAGFGHAMAEGPDWRRALDGLGSRFNILAMTQKNHAACGHAHAAIDAILALRTAHGLKPADILRIHVATYRQATEITGNRHPRTAFEAKFSLPYCVAAALVLGRVRTEAFGDKALADLRVRTLMESVELGVEPRHDGSFPGRRAATVTIECTDGRRFEQSSLTRKGDPDNPLSDDELIDKYRELTIPIVGDSAAEALLETLWRIEALGDLSTLRVTDGASTRVVAGGAL